MKDQDIVEVPCRACGATGWEMDAQNNWSKTLCQQCKGWGFTEEPKEVEDDPRQ